MPEKEPIIITEKGLTEGAFIITKTLKELLDVQLRGTDGFVDKKDFYGQFNSKNETLLKLRQLCQATGLVELWNNGYQSFVDSYPDDFVSGWVSRDIGAFTAFGLLSVKPQETPTP